MSAKRNKKIPAKKKVKANNAKLSWFFPSTDHGENHGFADSLLEYFQGDHEKYIAREAIQNSVDARLDYSVPVSVVFERLSIKPQDVPGKDELLSCMGRCLTFVKGQEKAEKFFKGGIALLKSNKLPVLKISDFNTKGLSGGDSEVEGNWYRLVRAAGTSNFKGVGGGSFGIGKGAPIAASLLRTVFYSSINDKNELVCQGKARLVSHHNEVKDVRQGVGFFGVEGYKAIRQADLVPALFKREERGTDIFVIGYDAGPEWKERLIKSVLHNFWLTILHGNLEVTIRDGEEITISKDTLQRCFEEYDAGDSRFYFDAVTSSSSNIFEQDLRNIGKVTLYVRKNDGYPGRIMMVRKPKMLVQEKSYRVLREPYAGVFICENDRGNEILRDMEPPAHDKWDYARAVKGPAALRELDAFVKQSLKTMAESLTSEPEDIPGLDRYLPDSEERDYMPSEVGEALEETGLSTGEESGREIGAEKEADMADTGTVIRKSIVTNKQEDKVSHIPPEGPGNGSRGRATGQKEGTDDGVRIKTSSISFRSFVHDTKRGMEYRLAITAHEDCEGAIRLVAIGDDGSYPIDITWAKDARTGKVYEIGDSLIKDLSIEAGEKLKLAVKLPSANKYALGIETYEG
jgi:hypothetical protein